MVSSLGPPLLSTPNWGVFQLHPHIFSLANPEGKERVKGKVCQIQGSRIGSALVCVRRNVQRRDSRLPKCTRFALTTVLMAAVSTCGPSGCPVSPPPLSSQNAQSHKNAPISHRVQGETKTTSLALGANPEGKERVKCKASRIQSSRIGPALIYVRRNAQHLELRFPKSTRFVHITVVMVAVSTCGPIGCPLSPPPLSPPKHTFTQKAPTSRRARGKT